MALLIDGYNLLHVTGIFGRGGGPGTFQRSRHALLNFLAAAIEPDQLAQTTVVFDAKEAPPGLPRTVSHRGITVHYAAGYADADDLIEELIQAAAAPRSLTVVSSDHRIQRAARRRRAVFVDSEPWYADMVRRKRSRHAGAVPDVEIKPSAPLSQDEIQWWLRQFGVAESPLAAASTGPTDPPGPALDSENSDKRLKPSESGWEDLANPFPPGYAEDLLDDDEL